VNRGPAAAYLPDQHAGHGLDSKIYQDPPPMDLWRQMAHLSLQPRALWRAAQAIGGFCNEGEQGGTGVIRCRGNRRRLLGGHALQWAGTIR